MDLTDLHRRIEGAARKAGRDPSEIKIVAVVKNVPTDRVLRALSAGITDIGENRVQEAQERYALVKTKFPGTVLHMIGHLQTNKVGRALDIFDIIHSVDNERLVKEIGRRAACATPILIEVNTSHEKSKFGVEPERAIDLIRFASSFEKIKIQGLMTVGRLTDDPEKARPGFRELRQLRDEIVKLGLPGVEMRVLSMGMTNDFEVAIEEGANIIRLGRAIFND